jgi:hypothetical protein
MATPLVSHAFTSKSVLTSTASVAVTGGAATLTIAIKNVANNAAATAISWTAAAGQSWTTANQYIQLNTALTIAGAGIQTYTDNLAADASPKYTGLISSYTQTPAGLVSAVGTSTGTATLPLAWEIVNSTAGVNGAVEPNAGSSSPNSYAWFYYEDKSQVAVPTSSAAVFTNGAPFITVAQAGNSVHFGQAPYQFGSAVPPYYLYLEGNFVAAVGGTTYQTTTLRLELYTQ